MQTSKSRRNHERVWHKIPALLTTQSGKIVRGTTKDLSIRGVLLEVENPPVAVLCGEQGTVQLDLRGLSDKIFTCEVSHVNEIHVGLHILKPAENFGFLLSQALFAELKQPDTEEIPLDWSAVHVTLSKPSFSPLQGKMLRLTSDWIEFCCLPEHHIPFSPGEEVVVHLTLPGTDLDVLKIRGFVAEPLHFLGPKTNCPHAEVLKKVAFASSPMENVERLVGLIRRVHASKIAAIMKTRALTNALLGGEESPPPSRTDTLRNIRRFFSHMWQGP